MATRELLRRPKTDEDYAEKLYRQPRADQPIYPLDAPGLAFPGFDMMEMAKIYGDTTELEPAKTKKGEKSPAVLRAGRRLTDLYRKALYERDFSLNLSLGGGRTKVVTLTPGHIWGETDIYGPAPADVMVIGKILGADEFAEGRNMIGPSGQLLLDTLRKLGIKGMPKWYVTNLIKTLHPDPGKSTLKPIWVKEFLPMLQQELRLVRPKYILCLGADALKAVTAVRGISVTSMEGRVIELEYPINTSHEEKTVMHKALLAVCIHPAQVLRQNEMLRPFTEQISRFGRLLNGERPDLKETDVDHRVISKESQLKMLVREILTCKESYEPTGAAVIAVDGEWHGEHPENAGSYIRTIQISWAHKKAASIVLTHTGGAPAFLTNKGHHDQRVAIELLKKILKNTPDRQVRIVGQFFNADLEWLVAAGLDIRDEFAAPKTWQETVSKGGFDTGLACHSLDETGDFKLEHMGVRYTGCPRYDVELQNWKTRWCKERNLKAKDLEGYGECPIEILGPYGCYDADVTRRLYFVLQKLLTVDQFGNCCREPFWISMRAAPSVLEIHRTGITVDKARVDELTKLYMKARDELQQKVRKWARWDDFNINSLNEVREFLFNEKLNGARDKEDASKIVRLRPLQARCLNLEPLFDTSKPNAIPWAQLASKGLEREHTPGTDKQILALLAQEAQEHMLRDPTTGKLKKVDRSAQVNLIRNYRFISQVLKSTLRPPKTIKDPDSKDDVWVKDSEGFLVYAGGLAGSICDDNRVRTHIYQTKETGRWSSARPPLQNLSKKREADYKTILGEDYKYPLRSVLRASPGHCLVEADFIGAELFGMAIMSGDQAMIEHCQRNQLKEDDPNYYDIHSNVAVFAFGLDCPPTKKGLASIDREYLRIVAKAVIFGIAYGRGAKAIALEAKEQGVKITVDEAQTIIDAIFAMYPKLQPFFESCEERCVKPRWLCGPFGRFRRFAPCHDEKMIPDIQRQAKNFPIQGMIADAASRALDHLYYYPRGEGHKVSYKIVLQIHDAIILEVPYASISRVIDKVLPRCMIHKVPIYPADLSGEPLDGGPYFLGIDTEVCTHWGVPMGIEECFEAGIDPKYAHWEKHKEGWNHGKFDTKTHRRYWLPKRGWLEIEKPKK